MAPIQQPKRIVETSTVIAGVLLLFLMPFAVLFEGFEWPGSVGRSPVAVSDFQIDDHAPSDGYWSVYAAVRSLDSCPALKLDHSVTLAPVHFVGFGRACNVIYADLWVPIELQREAETVLTGTRYRTGDWTMKLVDDSPRELHVYESGRSVVLYDTRLLGLPQSTEAGDAVRRETRFHGARAGIIEGVILFAVLLIGGLLLPRERKHGPERPVLALLAGLGAVAGAGLMFPKSLWPLAIALAVGASSRVVWARRGKRSGWASHDVPVLGWSLVSLVVISTWSRATGAVVFAHADNMQYLSSARALSEGKLEPSLVSLKRGLGQQPIHSLGYTLGVEGIQSLGTVLFLVALAWSLLLVRELSAGPGLQRIASLSMVGVVFASPQVLTMARAVNSHFLVALLLLLLVTQIGLVESAPVESCATESRTTPAAVAAIVALVVLRPEGTLLAALVLLGTLRTAAVPQPALWRWLGAATIAWNGILVEGHIHRGEAPARVVIAMLAIGVGLSAAPTVLRRVSPRLVRNLALVVGVVLWAVTLVLLIGDAGNVRFLDSAVGNVGQGRGRWGSAGVLLFLFAIFAVALPERPGDGAGLIGARWALIGFIPLSLLSKLGDGLQISGADLEILLSGGGRIGWADSVNRMWTHAILLVLLLVIVRFTQGRSGDEEADDDQVGAGQEREA